MVYLISGTQNSPLDFEFPVSLPPTLQSWTYCFSPHQGLPSCALFQALYFTQSDFSLSKQLSWHSTHGASGHRTSDPSPHLNASDQFLVPRAKKLCNLPEEKNKTLQTEIILQKMFYGKLKTIKKCQS